MQPERRCAQKPRQFPGAHEAPREETGKTAPPSKWRRAALRKPAQNPSPIQCSKSALYETSLALRSFPQRMNDEHDTPEAAGRSTMDRQIIRVDLAPSHAGIMVALRRAFEAAASEPSDRDFAELLRQLN